MNEENLKPVVFEHAQTPHTSQNTHMQTLLLKAVSEGVTDVKELVKISGAKSAAQVFKTFDKMSIRKEYHSALAENGLSLDTIVGGIKELAFGNMTSDKIKLGSLQTLLKSLGLDKYEKEEDAGKSWEEAVIKIAQEEASAKLKLPKENLAREENVIDEYKVDTPIIPKSVKIRQDEEKKIANELYGD